MSPFSRRQLLQGALLAGSGLAVPRLTRASADPLARKFLFVFARGGWDPSWALAPVDGSTVYRDPAAVVETVGGIDFVDHPDHRAVGEFFTSWGDQACLLHGLEVRSITHEACRRILFTGGTDPVADDWPARIAGASGGWELPDLVLSGPAFSAKYSNSVVRVGPDGQLQKLLSGTALSESDQRTALPSETAEAAVARFVAERTEAFQAAAGSPQSQRFAGDLKTALDQRELVRSLVGDLDLTVESTGYVSLARRMQPAVQAFSRGLSRCAIGTHDGQWDVGWDTHSGIAAQSDHFRVLFEELDELMGELATTFGPGGGRLLDEVTVVVFSEMGRAPRLNATGGKDHWTTTSALLLGAGVRGDQAIGGYDEALLGLPVDPRSGEISDGGLRLSAGDLGATLVAMAGLDPDELADGHTPIRAAISD